MTVDYDELWTESWGDAQDFSPVHRHITRILVDTVRGLPGVKSILDVGCGTGANLEALQRELGIEDITGIDLSDKALDVARQRVRGEFSVFDVMADAPLPRKYDLVMTSQVIEHVEQDDLFLQKLHAMCGRYVFVGTIQGKMRKSEVSIGHLRNYTRAGLEAKMRAAGFDIVRAIEWGFPFFSPLYRTTRELLGGDSAAVGQSGWHKPVLASLYHLYRLNSHTHGDILMVLGKPRA